MAAAEQKKSYEVVKNFKGLNTKANRTAIGDEEFSWLENAMPIGFGNLKITSAPTDLLITFTNTVVDVFPANIGTTDYIVAFEADGSAEYVNLTTNTLGTIAPAGTFSASGINVGQWKNERILIVDAAKGCFTWNGIDLISVGSIGQIGIVNAGTGYVSAPAVIISAPNQTNGVQATAACTITSNAVSSITLFEAGSGYTSAPTVTFSGGGGNNATAIAGLITFAKGTVSVNVTNGGTGYTNAANLIVTISGGGGVNAAGNGIVSGGRVTQVIMKNNGTNYTNSANISVTITGGGGNNATASAVINLNDNSGIQSFSGRAWIVSGRTVYYSAAGSYNDFVTVSSGTITLTDSTLHGNIRQILSANNFLYLFGDDSINVFSDVRVTTAGTTLFTNTNISASVGTRLPHAIFPYFRSVLFMNDYGVYALVGSTTTKISDSLDGIFPDIDLTNYEVTCGQVLINNILCAAFNFRYTGGDGASPANRWMQAIFFEKKWFFTSQGNDTKNVVSVPFGGKVNLYGTNGKNLLQFYSSASASINSYIQTSLNPMKDPIRTKQALKAGVEATLSGPAQLNIMVDSEINQGQPILLSTPATWINNVGTVISWTNNALQIIGWYGGGGYILYKSDAKQYGKYLGMTVTSPDAGITISGFEYEHELRTRF